jgi:serine/threonine protein kinase
MDKLDVLNDKYRIINILGQGGMGEVYLAENIKLGTLWSIKKIKKSSFLYCDRKYDLDAEANILKKLSHPSLPKIFDILEDEKSIYLVVEYIEGESLDKKLYSHGRFSEKRVVDWAIQLCDVLSYLHTQKPKPIIYRDMKPSNIILASDGQIKLIDFGIAREYNYGAESDTICLGTKGYAAPEQYGGGQSSEVTDIYSLGVTLHQLLTGADPSQPPYQLKPVRAYDSDLSEEIEDIIYKCTRPDPKERYSSAAQLKKDFEILAEAGPSGQVILNESKAYGVDWKNGFSNRPFKKLVLTVWDNAEFGCELAYTIAKSSGYTVALIDMDLLSPKADIFLNIKRYPENLKGEAIIGKGGLSIVIDSLDKNCFTSSLLFEAAAKRKELSNLYILTGSYKLHDYEYFNNSSASRLIENAYRNFDISILLVNKSIYDSFTVLSLIKSDYNFIAIPANLDKLREFNNYMAFLKDKQNILLEKNKFVIYEYDKLTQLSRSDIKEATGSYPIAFISYSKKRAEYRNLRGTYVKQMERHITEEYKELLLSLNIIPRSGIIERIKKLFPDNFQILSLKRGDESEKCPL